MRGKNCLLYAKSSSCRWKVDTFLKSLIAEISVFNIAYFSCLHFFLSRFLRIVSPNVQCVRDFRMYARLHLHCYKVKKVFKLKENGIMLFRRIMNCLMYYIELSNNSLFCLLKIEKKYLHSQHSTLNG